MGRILTLTLFFSTRVAWDFLFFFIELNIKTQNPANICFLFLYREAAAIMTDTSLYIAAVQRANYDLMLPILIPLMEKYTPLRRLRSNFFLRTKLVMCKVLWTLFANYLQKSPTFYLPEKNKENCQRDRKTKAR